MRIAGIRPIPALELTCREDPGQMKPSKRWTEALKRARLEATISAPRDGENQIRRKWRNAKTVITGLQNDDCNSDESDDTDDSDSQEEERRRTRRQVLKMKRGKVDAKVMESPVSAREV
jgi:hypothetical protein